MGIFLTAIGKKEGCMGKPRWIDKGWAYSTGERWSSRIVGSPPTGQCGGCTFYTRLDQRSPLSADWGVCTSSESAYDGEAVFEHDGCSSYDESPWGWGADPLIGWYRKTRLTTKHQTRRLRQSTNLKFSIADEFITTD